MKHQFNEAKIENGFLCLKVKNLPAARQFVYEMKKREYDAEIKEHREQRSLDANAYCWVLLTKLASVLSMKKEDVYRQLITSVGNNFEILPVRSDAVSRFIFAWEGNGIGWVCENTGTSKLHGYANVIAYYGSSTYDTKQMSCLIDLIVQECREQGIETKTPEELSRLMEDWHAKSN